MERHKEGQKVNDRELDPDAELSFSEKEDRISTALERAQKLREREEYDRGIDELMDALRLGIKKDRVYYRLGNIYFDAGDLDRAEYAYKRAIEENEEHVNSQHNLAVVYKKQGKIRKFVKQRKKANKLELKDPNDPTLSEEERSYAKKFAFKLILLIVGGLAGLGLIIYLVTAFLI